MSLLFLMHWIQCCIRTYKNNMNFIDHKADTNLNECKSIRSCSGQCSALKIMEKQNVGTSCENTLTLSLRLEAFTLEFLYQTWSIYGPTFHLLYGYKHGVPHNVLPTNMTKYIWCFSKIMISCTVSSLFLLTFINTICPRFGLHVIISEGGLIFQKQLHATMIMSIFRR